MATRVGVGESRHRKGAEAGREAAAAAVARMGGGTASLVLVFATAGHDQDELLAGVRDVTGDAPLSGCSGAGVITRRGSDEGSRAVAVMAIASDRIAFDTLLIPGLGGDPAGAGRAIAAAAARCGRRDPRMLLLFPDGLTGNLTAFLRGLGEGLTSPLRVVGGAAGELHRFERTFQYHDGRVASDSVAAVLVSGGLAAEVAVAHGCDLLGVEHEITRADGAIVHEIDGRPAWAVLREYLDDPEAGFDATSVPYLCVAQILPSGGQVIRVPLRLERETGALFFPGELRPGDRVIMARRDADRVRDSATAAARAIRDARPGATPAFVLQFDCVGRGRLLYGEQVTEQLIAPVQRVFPEEVAWIGFHSYGEIGPHGGTTYFHNYTMVLCAIYDA